VRNAGPATATLEVLPTLWFRNTWSWGLDPVKPSLIPEALLCENETNTERL
jgi:hypothetical protein